MYPVTWKTENDLENQHLTKGNQKYLPIAHFKYPIQK